MIKKGKAKTNTSRKVKKEKGNELLLLPYSVLYPFMLFDSREAEQELRAQMDENNEVVWGF